MKRRILLSAAALVTVALSLTIATAFGASGRLSLYLVNKLLLKVCRGIGHDTPRPTRGYRRCHILPSLCRVSCLRPTYSLAVRHDDPPGR